MCLWFQREYLISPEVHNYSSTGLRLNRNPSVYSLSCVCYLPRTVMKSLIASSGSFVDIGKRFLSKDKNLIRECLINLPTHSKSLPLVDNDFLFNNYEPRAVDRRFIVKYQEVAALAAMKRQTDMNRERLTGHAITDC